MANLGSGGRHILSRGRFSEEGLVSGGFRHSIILLRRRLGRTQDGCGHYDLEQEQPWHQGDLK